MVPSGDDVLMFEVVLVVVLVQRKKQSTMMLDLDSSVDHSLGRFS